MTVEVPATGKQLFEARIRREGRWDEYKQLWAKEKERDDAPPQSAYGRAMRAMGYEGIKKERRLERERMENIHRNAQNIKRARLKAARDERAREVTFDEALSALPPSASSAKELEWVHCHPAMQRLDEAADKTKRIALTLDDVIGPSPAPSQQAVRTLQRWVNEPREFFKQRLTVQQKQANDGAGPGGSSDSEEDLEEIERMLATVESAATVEIPELVRAA